MLGAGARGGRKLQGGKMSDGGEKRTNLGRGLAALLGDDSEDFGSLDRARLARQVPIEHLHPSRVQPRSHFDKDALDSLADSIREQGLIQPILVRRHPERESEFEIVAGERRWRAAQQARLHEVPIVLRDLTDGEALELAIVENVQRQDLNPLEEAEGYRRLMDEFSHTQEDLGRTIGKSRSHIANTLRLLSLPEEAKGLLRDGSLTAGHGRALLASGAPEELARRILREGLSVRAAERLASQAKAAAKPKPRGAKPASPGKDADTLALERDLSELLGLRVTIDMHSKGGTIAIHYANLEQLDDVLNRLNQSSGPGAADALA